MRRSALLWLMLLLSACSLRPLYGGGPTGAAGQLLGSVEVPKIDGKAGWLVRNALQDRLGSVDANAPRYRLEVELDDQITGFGVRRDDAITRERRTLRARYKLVDADGKVVLDATTGSDAGIDAVGSEYATVAAEESALERLATIIADQIVVRLARFAEAPPVATTP